MKNQYTKPETKIMLGRRFHRCTNDPTAGVRAIQPESRPTTAKNAPRSRPMMTGY